MGITSSLDSLFKSISKFLAIFFSAVILILIVYWLFDPPWNSFINFILIIIGFMAVSSILKNSESTKALGIFVFNFYLCLLIFASIFCTVFVFAQEAIIEVWRIFYYKNTTFFGAMKIGGPIFALFFGALFFAHQDKPLTSAVKILKWCMWLAFFSVLANLVFPDWVAIKNKELKLRASSWANKERVSQYTEERNQGLYVVAQKDKKARFFIFGDKGYFIPVSFGGADVFLQEGVKYPLLEEEDMDGQYRLLKVRTPDKNGEFTGQAGEAWVRLKEVNIVNEEDEQPKYSPPPTPKPRVEREDSETVYGPGIYRFNLKAGQETGWLIISDNGAKLSCDLSSRNWQYQLVFDDGFVYDAWTRSPIAHRHRLKFKIRSLENQEVNMVIKRI